MHVRLGELLTDEVRSAWKEDGKRPAFAAVLERCRTRASHGVDRAMGRPAARQPWDLEQLLHVGDKTRYRVITKTDTYHFDKWREVDELRGEIRAGQRESGVKSASIRDKVGVRLDNGDGATGGRRSATGGARSTSPTSSSPPSVRRSGGAFSASPTAARGVRLRSGGMRMGCRRVSASVSGPGSRCAGTAST